MPQIYKPNGRPRGRPPKLETKQRTVSATLDNAPHMAEVFALTDEQIDATPAHGLLRMLIKVAIKARDSKTLQALALGLLPYEMARKTEANMTPEEIKHVIDMAQAEVARRGYDLTNVARLPDRMGDREAGPATGTNG
jgi:hypothetical protein